MSLMSALILAQQVASQVDSDRGTAAATAGGSPVPAIAQDAVAALVALGYSFGDADGAVRAALADGEPGSADELIRAALAQRAG